jgi:hypothetical protein
MWQRRVPSTTESNLKSDHRGRMRDNLLSAIVMTALLITGAWLADELTEASQSCYPPDAGCEARGVPIPTVGLTK